MVTALINGQPAPNDKSPVAREGKVVLMLGPTNTGKTHRAIERMLEFPSGMIGLPLRLLAREVYDKITARVGESRVALITGEEKRVPPHPSYWVATVEAMPRERPVAFVAIDEIQLAAHPERGHVFSERLLTMRGTEETWLLGADTMRPLLSQLLPDATHERCPRLSELRWARGSSLGALPRRSALVAFSIPRVLELADRLRQRRGGAAVVIGALSPRARNAQVAMYQAGEVDFIVATDAIGMGLNLDIDHVAFAELRKYDGREVRELDVAEIAQIAGRAGRYLTHGTFGTLTGAGALVEEQGGLSPNLAARIEQHRFEPLTRLYYRSADLDFASPAALVASLRAAPPSPRFVRVDRTADAAALAALHEKPEVAERARSEELVRLLWAVASVPDYRQLLFEDHVRVLTRMFVELADRGRLERAWIEAEIARLRDPSRDLHTLMDRISDVRIWNYVCHQAGWVDGAEGLREAARETEDELSEALHRALVARFVDPHPRVRAPSGEVPQAPRSAPGRNGKVPPPPKSSSSGAKAPPATPSSPFSKLAELRDRMGPGPEPPRLEAGSQRWLEDLFEAPHEAFSCDESGAIEFRGRRVGRLTRGRTIDAPDVAVLLEVQGGARLRLNRRLLAFGRDLVVGLTGALGDVASGASGTASASVRGLIHQLVRGLGTVTTRDAHELVLRLTPEERASLERAEVRFGATSVHLTGLTKPEQLRLRAVLATAFGGLGRSPFPIAGELSVPALKHVPEALYVSVGYPVVAGRAVRCDVLERFHGRLVALPPGAPLDATRLASWLGCKPRDALAVAEALAPRAPERLAIDPGAATGPSTTAERATSKVALEQPGEAPLQASAAGENRGGDDL